MAYLNKLLEMVEFSSFFFILRRGRHHVIQPVKERTRAAVDLRYRDFGVAKKALLF